MCEHTAAPSGVQQRGTGRPHAAAAFHFSQATLRLLINSLASRAPEPQAWGLAARERAGRGLLAVRSNGQLISGSTMLPGARTGRRSAGGRSPAPAPAGRESSSGQCAANSSAGRDHHHIIGLLPEACSDTQQRLALLLRPSQHKPSRAVHLREPVRVSSAKQQVRDSAHQRAVLGSPCAEQGCSRCFPTDGRSATRN